MTRANSANMLWKIVLFLCTTHLTGVGTQYQARVDTGVGIVATTMERVHFKRMQWNFAMRIPIACIDDMAPVPMYDLIMMSYRALNGTMAALEISSLHVNGSFRQAIAPMLQASHVQSFNIYNSFRRILTRYAKIKLDAETAYGAVEPRLCSALSEAKYDLFKTTLQQMADRPNFTSDHTEQNDDEAKTILGVRGFHEPSLEELYQHYTKLRSKREAPQDYNFPAADTVNILNNSTLYQHSRGTNMGPIIANSGGVKTHTTTTPQPTTHSPGVMKVQPEGNVMSADTNLEQTKREYRDALDELMNRVDMPSDQATVDRTKLELNLYKAKESIRSLFIKITSQYEKLIKQCDHFVSPQPSATRRKRGLLNFVGDLFHSAFGTATDDQIAGLNKTLDIMREGMRNHAEEIQTIRNDSITLIQGYQRVSEESIKRVVGEINKMSKRVDELATVISRVDQKLEQRDSVIMYLAHQAQLQILFSQLERQINDLDMILSNVEDFFLQVHEAFVGKHLPTKLMPHREIKKAMHELKLLLPPHLELPSSVSLSELAYTTPYAVAISGYSIAVVLHVPIVDNALNSQAWNLQMVPVYIKGVWLCVTDTDHILLYHKDQRKWQQLSMTQYMMCLQDRLHICPFEPTWLSTEFGSCGLSIVTGFEKSEGQCEASNCTRHQTHHVKAAQINETAWLVANPLPNTHGTKRCVDLKSRMSSNMPTQVPPFGIIEVSPTCELEINDLILTPASQVAGSYHLDGTQGELPEGLTVGRISIVDLSEQYSTDGPINITTVHDLVNTTDVIFTSDRASFKRVVEMITGKNHVFADRESKLAEKLGEKIRGTEYHSDSTFSLFGMGMLVDSAWIIHWIISIILCVITFRLYCRNSIQNRGFNGAYGLPMAAPLALTPTRSFALPIGPQPTEKPIMTTTPNLTQVAELPVRFIDSMSSTPYLIHFAGMIVIMAICHILLTRHITRRLKRTQFRLGYIPENRSVQIHPGENKLVASIVFGLSRMCGSQRQLIEANLVVCSLPGKPMSWKCVVQAPSANDILMNTTTRLSDYLTIPIQWGTLCLRSDEFPHLDTCQELPTIIKVRMSDVLEQSKCKALPGWWRISAISYTSLSIVAPGYSKRLYSYYDRNLETQLTERREH